MKVAIALVFCLISTTAYAQQNPFAQRLDQLTPPAGQPICSDWYAQVALPQFGCHPETIQKICAGQLPKVNSGPFCGGLEGSAQPAQPVNTCEASCNAGQKQCMATCTAQHDWYRCFSYCGDGRIVCMRQCPM